ncbi:zinc finger protein CONSTANS-LIKE 4 [Oryza brachyantha]|uniref:zinc finger protein CONSTANS-LIKE 4 n=1 Tax=Oryza brachyantha TaxID=4533 RepID=UPI00077612BC|nr:zinc finger protein CONSTANS-LIKE 4 [Oryza brachyantha]
MASGGGGRGRRRKARRGARAKAKRKTKYLSLSRHLIKVEEDLEAVRLPEVEVEVVPKEETPSSPEEGGDGREEEKEEEQEKRQMEVFALNPEPSTLFAAAPSLIDILGASAGGSESSSASQDVSGGGTDEFPGEEDDLARRALRGRERWVYCSSSSPSGTTTTSSSCSSAASTGASSEGGAARSLLLKLDHEEILAAWAGRGSLYIGGAVAAAATTGAGHGAAELELDSVFVEVGPSSEAEPTAAGAWSVAGTAARAEKVRRYKEKRQGRLFAKRIRYEVRRLNAVKRPRLKGRFIREKEGATIT